MKLHVRIKYPCGLVSDISMELWSGSFLGHVKTGDLKICPMHGRECRKAK